VKEIAGVEDYDARYPSVLEEVRADAQLGKKLGVTGTPTFFLNGIKMPSVRVAHLEAAFDYELQKAGVQPVAP
jgi:protein-disulfide isomerase